MERVCYFFFTLKLKFIWSETSKSWYIKLLHPDSRGLHTADFSIRISFLQAWFSFVFWINSNGQEPVLTLWPTTLALFTVMFTWEQSSDLFFFFSPWKIQTTSSHEEGRWHVGELGLGSVRTSEFRSQLHTSSVLRESFLAFRGSAFFIVPALSSIV